MTPAEFEQLSPLLTAHRMRAESVRHGRWTPRASPEDIAIRAWARANGPKLMTVQAAAPIAHREEPERPA
ncbi:hypothetical protein [Nocardia brasiliensis]|uniref:hypothetical protein n=1 Tax=Nocardia brasiliensis TaxID=37326 RepID=UPI002455B973|nr:hypothetical protein [Nocardia brasiliensis]